MTWNICFPTIDQTQDTLSSLHFVFFGTIHTYSTLALKPVFMSKYEELLYISIITSIHE